MFNLFDMKIDPALTDLTDVQNKDKKQANCVPVVHDIIMTKSPPLLTFCAVQVENT